MSQWLSAVWGLCWDELLPENLQENSMPTWEEILFRQSMPLKICQLTPGLSWSVSNYRTIKEIFCTMEPKASLGIQHLFVFRNPDTSKNACQALSGPLPSAIKCMVFSLTSHCNQPTSTNKPACEECAIEPRRRCLLLCSSPSTTAIGRSS